MPCSRPGGRGNRLCAGCPGGLVSFVRQCCCFFGLFVALLLPQYASFVSASDIGGLLVDRAFDVIVSLSPEEQFRSLAAAASIGRLVSCGNAAVTTHERLRTTPEERLRLAVHESGHALALMDCERTSSYDEWFARGPWARLVALVRGSSRGESFVSDGIRVASSASPKLRLGETTASVAGRAAVKNNADKQKKKKKKKRSIFSPLASFGAAENRPRFELRGVRLHLGAGATAAAGTTPYAFCRKPVVIESRDLEALLRVVLSGRAAEHELLGRPSSGASADLDYARRLALIYVDLGFGPSGRLLASRDAQARQARRMVDRAYVDARKFASRHRAELTRLSKALFFKEALSAKAARAVVRATYDGTDGTGDDHAGNVRDPFGRFVFDDDDHSASRREGNDGRRTNARRARSAILRGPAVRHGRLAVFELSRLLRDVFRRWILWSVVVDLCELRADACAKAAAAKKHKQGGSKQGTSQPRVVGTTDAGASATTTASSPGFLPWRWGGAPTPAGVPK